MSWRRSTYYKRLVPPIIINSLNCLKKIKGFNYENLYSKSHSDVQFQRSYGKRRNVKRLDNYARISLPTQMVLRTLKNSFWCWCVKHLQNSFNKYYKNAKLACFISDFEPRYLLIVLMLAQRSFWFRPMKYPQLIIVGQKNTWLFRQWF